ncbi:PDC sensor domain-containing protein [Rhizobium sp. SG_E_25_P2]|uniref:PDC sensor domain-containing protein n=1 Tax=Rhizobium sp. SG_E_25_P2 TaxID=2879942 RepID=UPI0032AF60D0
MRYKLTAVLMAAAMITPWAAQAEEAHVAPITDYVKANVAPWIKDPAVIDAIKAQNAKTAGLSAADIDALDKAWRAEVDGGDRKMIDEVLGNAASKFLHEKQEASEGVISEIFVMDAKGLNVGQSDVTSDYWQGDEDKFQKSFGAGAEGFFVDEVEKDESTQALQSQASMTIVDESGAPIGAVTIGINLDAL